MPTVNDAHQSLLPWSLFKGSFAVGSVSVDIPSGFAVILSDVFLQANAEAGSAEFVLEDDSGNVLFEGVSTSTSTPTFVPFVWSGEAEIGQPASLQLTIYSSTMIGFISGYLVTPPSSTLTP